MPFHHNFGFDSNDLADAFGGGGGGNDVSGDPFGSSTGFADQVLATGSALGLSALEAQQQRDAASSQRTWQERMSSSSYQRSMLDMKLAGLNPILAYQKGGASTPSGAVAKVPDYQKAVGSALGMVRQKQELKNMKKQAKLLNSQKNNVDMNTWLTAVQRDHERLKKEGQALTNTITGELIPGALIEGGIDRSGVGAAMRVLQRSSSSVQGISTAASAARRAVNK